MDIGNFFDECFFQDGVGVADEVVQGGIEGVSYFGGHVNGRFDLISLIASDGDADGTHFFGQLVL